MNSDKFLEYLKVLCYLKSRSPEYVKGNELKDLFFDGSKKKLETCVKTLRESNLIDSNSGSQGGYTYSPYFDKKDILGKNIDKLLNNFTFNNVEELNRINLSINGEENIKKIKELSFGSLALVNDLKYDSTILSSKEKKIMLNIVDAIRDKHKIKIKYIASNLNDDDSINIYEVVLAPINFYIFNGICYLNAYYEKIHDKKLTGELVTRRYVVNRIDENSIIHLDTEHFKIKSKDKEIIKNKLPYEIYDSNNELVFKIKLSYVGYNCFNRTFKNYYSDFIEYKEKYSIIEIKTKSYLECTSNLLSLGNTFEFIDSNESQIIKELYLKTIDELKEKNK